MKERKEIDFTRVYGDVPESFSRRVEYALRQTQKQEETHALKRKPLMAILIAALLLALTGTAVAAVMSHTIDFFGLLYGEEFRTKLEQGQVAPGGQSTTVNGVSVTMTDFVVTHETTTWLTGQGEVDQPVETMFFYATGVIAPAEGENLILMAWDEYTVNDPAGYALFWGDDYPAPPEGAPTYAELAKERGAAIRMVNCVANGILDENGEVYQSTIGSTVIPRTDGTLHVSIEIPSENIIPQQDSYRMSIAIITMDVTAEGEYLEDTKAITDWVVELVPQQAE